MFDVKTVRSFDEGSLNLKDYQLSGLIEFVGRTRNNNGIKGYTEILEIEPNFENVFSVSQIGTIVAQLRKYKWYASQNIFSLNLKTELETLFTLYTLTSINKALKGSFSDGYGNYPTLDKLKKLKIQLPVASNNFYIDFMNNFTATIERQRIEKLNSYLVENGLNNYRLSGEEKQAIEDFKKGDIEFKDFSYQSIFNCIKQGRRLKKDDQIAGNIPFVMAGVTNTGVVDYISNPVASFPKNSITVDIFGNTFYRNYNYGAGDDTGVYWQDKEQYSKETMLFIATSMQKSILGKFDYGTKLRSSKSVNFKMQLPSKGEKPNFEYMNTLMSAIQKLVIKKVVLYVEEKLKKPKNQK